MKAQVEIRIDASRYVDEDDCLAAAADDYAREHGLAGWELSPRWADGQRDEIMLTVPLWSVRVEVAFDHEEGTEFVAWLRAQGCGASLGATTADLIDGREDREGMRDLWRRYCDQGPADV